jgi:DNA repair ATPase RecN
MITYFPEKQIDNHLKIRIMKRIFLCLMIIGLSTFSFQAKAQWTVIDPTNLVQNIRSAVQGTTTATNMIKNVQESVKIYNQGKEYYDALKSVHNLIKDARKVRKTIEMVSEITDIYLTGFNKMVGDANFTPNELAAISAGYAKLLEEVGALVTELKNIVTGGNDLSLSDKERMEVIDLVYDKMLEYRNLTRYYTQKSISVSFIRAKKKNDTDRVLSLYGSPSERYW